MLVFLSACSGGGAYSLAYPASGNSGNLLGVTQSQSFRNSEDINIVVKLNNHDGVTVEVQFLDPDKTQVGETLSVEADSDTGSVLLGLDYEQYAGDLDLEWPTGTWTAVISIDGEEVDRITFTVLS